MIESASSDSVVLGLNYRRRPSPAIAGYQPPPARFLFDRRILQPAARDIPLVPEPGTAWRRDIHRHDLAEGKAGALKGLATRNPMLLFSLDGSLSLRFEERRLFSLLFQEPPRSPREEPDIFPHADGRLRFLALRMAARKRQLSACETWPIHERTLA